MFFARVPSAHLCASKGTGRQYAVLAMISSVSLGDTYDILSVRMMKTMRHTGNMKAAITGTATATMCSQKREHYSDSSEMLSLARVYLPDDFGAVEHYKAF